MKTELKKTHEWDRTVPHKWGNGWGPYHKSSQNSADGDLGHGVWSLQVHATTPGLPAILILI